MRHTVLGEKTIQRAQPHAVAKSCRVLHRPQQHARVRQRRIGLAERLAAGLGQFVHLRQLGALQAVGQRADREHTRLIQRSRAAFEHLHQARFIQRGIGVRRTGQ